MCFSTHKHMDTLIYNTLASATMTNTYTPILLHEYCIQQQHCNGFYKKKQKKRGKVHTQASQAISDGLALFVLPWPRKVCRQNLSLPISPKGKIETSNCCLLRLLPKYTAVALRGPKHKSMAGEARHLFQWQRRNKRILQWLGGNCLFNLSSSLVHAFLRESSCICLSQQY